MELSSIGTVSTTASKTTTVADTSSAASTSSQTAGTTTSTASGLNSAPIVNPISHIDAALGLVVSETYNKEGTVVNQYPTERMLDSYRIYGVDATNGVTSSATASEASQSSAA